MLARSLAKLGVGADDIAVVSKHDTSTLANDPNETELHERLADSMGRSDGAPLFIVSQKSLTGHAKGGAAVFQMMGMCQMLRDGVIPPNRSLDCVDDELAGSEHFVWVRETLRLGREVPAEGGPDHQPRLRSRVRRHRAGAPAGLRRGARSRAAAGLPGAGRRADASRVSDGWPRRSRAAQPLYERPASNRRFDDEAPENRAGGGHAARSDVAGSARTDVYMHGCTCDSVHAREHRRRRHRPGLDPRVRRAGRPAGHGVRRDVHPGERRDAADKSSSAARHLAARWAAKEAVIKAWSGSRFSKRPVLPEGIHRDIEVVTDMWGRPRVRLTGAIAEHLEKVTIHLSLTHEGDTAAAVAVLEER